MIFQTQNQLNCVFIFIFFGIIVGLISIFYFLFFLEKYQKNLIKILINTVFYAFFSVFFAILINYFNFGKFSIVLFVLYSIGYVWIRILSGKLVVFLQNLWYNKIINYVLNIKSKFKRKGKLKTNGKSKKS